MYKKQSGITLIEVLVTLLITTIGLLGVAALQLSALKTTSDSAQRSQVVWLMQDLIERMRANPDGEVDDYLSNNNVVSCLNYPAKMCASYMATDKSVHLAAECTPVEMAVFDRWETQCSYSQDSSVDYTSRDSIISISDEKSILNLSKTDDENKGEMSLTASWLFKSSLDSSDDEIESSISEGFEQDIQRGNRKFD